MVMYKDAKASFCYNKAMPVIIEAKDIIVQASDKPLHSRENGGHIIIAPTQSYEQHYDLPPKLAAELTHMSMLVGEAATNVLRDKGIDVIRINYQENGNWAYKPGWTSEPNVHLHMFIRASGEKHPDNDSRFQAFPEALAFPPPETNYYDHFVPLTEEDCADIKSEMEHLAQNNKYQSLELI